MQLGQILGRMGQKQLYDAIDPKVKQEDTQRHRRTKLKEIREAKALSEKFKEVK